MATARCESMTWLRREKYSEHPSLSEDQSDLYPSKTRLGLSLPDRDQKIALIIMKYFNKNNLTYPVLPG